MQIMPIICNPDQPQVKPLLILGKPGLGKTAFAYHLQDYLQRTTGTEWRLIKLRVADLFAEDFSGLPTLDSRAGVTRWYPPDFLPLKTSGLFRGTRGILLLDEVNRAKPDVIQAMMKVFDRDEFEDGWMVVATGNLGDEDGTNVEEFDAAQIRRFFKVELEFNLDDWCEWAQKRGIDSRIIHFLKTFPQYAYFGNKEYGTVTPAHWEELDRYWKQQRDRMDLISLVKHIGSNLIGQAAATLVSFLESLETLGPEDLYKIDSPAVRTQLLLLNRDQVYRLNQALIQHFVKRRRNDVALEADAAMLSRYLNLVDEQGRPFLEDDQVSLIVNELCAHRFDLIEKLLNRDENLRRRYLMLLQSPVTQSL